MRKVIAMLAVCLLLAGTSFGANFQSVGLYQSFSQMVDWANTLQAANPDIVQVVQFGQSSQDRPLLAIHITADVGAGSAGKPEFLFTAGIHAREVIGSQAAYNLASKLISGYRSGDAIDQNILATRDVWVIPNMNPDGRVEVEGGHSTQRKNMQLYPGQDYWTTGVDLNRNFPHRWADASSDVRDETYRGPSALSTPEASWLWAFLRDPARFPNLLASIDFHSGYQAIIPPWNSPSDIAANPLPPADAAKFNDVGQGLSAASGIAVRRLGYDSYGTLGDSLYEEFHAYSFIEEIFQTSPYVDDFSYFNPTTQVALNDRVGKAFSSAMYLLSDDAFTVPEPTSFAVLAIGVVMLLKRRRQRKSLSEPKSTPRCTGCPSCPESYAS